MVCKLKLGYLGQYSVWLQTRWPGFNPWQRQRIVPLASVSRPALRPTQPPIQWVLGVLSHRRRWLGPNTDLLITHPHLMPRSRMSRSYTPLPLGTCMAVVGHLYFIYMVYKYEKQLHSDTIPVFCVGHLNSVSSGILKVFMTLILSSQVKIGVVSKIGYVWPMLPVSYIEEWSCHGIMCGFPQSLQANAGIVPYNSHSDIHIFFSLSFTISNLAI
jgi:hypothetical protein